METPSETPATSPEFSDELIIAAEQIARGRGWSGWSVGCLVWLGGGAVICAGTVAVWLFLRVLQTADVAIYRQQKRYWPRRRLRWAIGLPCRPSPPGTVMTVK